MPEEHPVTGMFSCCSFRRGVILLTEPDVLFFRHDSRAGDCCNVSERRETEMSQYLIRGKYIEEDMVSLQVLEAKCSRAPPLFLRRSISRKLEAKETAPGARISPDKRHASPRICNVTPGTGNDPLYEPALSCHDVAIVQARGPVSSQSVAHSSSDSYPANPRPGAETVG